jgi:hypothetical protein
MCWYLKEFGQHKIDVFDYTIPFFYWCCTRILIVGLQPSLDQAEDCMSDTSRLGNTFFPPEF